MHSPSLGRLSESDVVQALDKIWLNKEAHKAKFGSGPIATNSLSPYPHPPNPTTSTPAPPAVPPAVAAVAATTTLTDDAKTHAGVKYDRKLTGPFAGKLVSQGTIINIDGEDYVEYRVLTKPSFF